MGAQASIDAEASQRDELLQRIEQQKREAQQSSYDARHTLEELGIRVLADESVLQGRGWANMPGTPYFVEHPDIGLVQLVARHESGHAAEMAHLAVRRLNPVARPGDGPYVGNLYTVPAVAPHVHTLPLAIVEFRPAGDEFVTKSSASLGASGTGYVRILSSRAVVYTLPWLKLQRIMTLRQTDPLFERKLSFLQVDFIRSWQDVDDLQHAVRLLERCHPRDVRAWTSVVPSEAEVWGDALRTEGPLQSTVPQPSVLGGDVQH
jgi:hypothetical protein